jgi:hypothetical protein
VPASRHPFSQLAIRSTLLHVVRQFLVHEAG